MFETKIDGIKVLGLINVNVLVSGSIFFGQTLSYDHMDGNDGRDLRTHQDQPARIMKTSDRITTTTDGNRVYRAPAYFRSNEMQTAYNYNGVVERPIVYNVGSFNPPTKDTPSLLSIDQVETVFHEFGHALHGMMTQVAYRGLAGTNVDRDLVEMPSQINEHWMLVPEVLKNYAKHYKTGEVLPQLYVDKLIESSKFNQGFMTTELVGAALLDIEWHKINWCDDIDVKAFERSVAKRLHMPKIIEYRYRSPYFKHIFNDEQYACGYYTYLWSQVLEADGWERFQQEGPMNVNVANDYRRYILEAGDTEDAMTLYKKFRGREPDAKALLRLRGLE